MSGTEGKPFAIPKQLVWQAWKSVQANGGAAGADGVTVEAFGKDLKNNLYKVWNRMSSGTYFPPPVRAVEIPRASGSTRILGVPTVGDRVAQTVAAMALEPRTEGIVPSWWQLQERSCVCRSIWPRLRISHNRSDLNHEVPPITRNQLSDRLANEHPKGYREAVVPHLVIDVFAEVERHLHWLFRHLAEGIR